GYDDDDHFIAARDAGAVAYLLKGSSVEELDHAILAATKHETYVTAKMHFAQNKTGPAKMQSTSETAKQAQWPSLPIGLRFQTPRSASERWAYRVLKACGAEEDLTTIEQWALAVGASYSAMTEMSRIIGIKPKDARD